MQIPAHEWEFLMSGAQGSWLWFLIDVGLVGLLGIVLAYGIARWQRSRSTVPDAAREHGTERLYAMQESPETSLQPRQPDPTAASSERPTEDDLAQAHLGGPRGAPELKPAKMTRQREIKTPKSVV